MTLFRNPGSATLLRNVGMLLWVMMMSGLGCVPDTVTVQTAPQVNFAAIRTVAVLPFDGLSTPQQTYSETSNQLFGNQGFYEADRNFRETTSPTLPKGPPIKTMTVPPEVAAKITRMVYAKLSLRPGLTLLPPEQIQPGVKLSVDAVLKGTVLVYREREGSKIAANPAAVGFEVKLVEPMTGEVLWAGNYYEEQKPMNEDFLGFIERRGLFVSAEELAQYGVDHLMKRLPLGLTSEKVP